METKANYVAVGAFVVICIVGLVVTLLWLAGAQYSQEYAYFQAYFKGPVTGLGKGTLTRYNGIEVGRVQALEFDPTDPQRVIVTLQVQPDLNIRADSVASIATQGLTGGSYVEISGGTRNAPLLTAREGQRYPVIRTKQSTLQQLEQTVPELVAKLDTASKRLNDLLSDQNRQAVSNILTSLDQTTATIARRSADIDATIRNANAAMANLNDASSQFKPVMDEATTTLKKYGKVADDADAFINGDGLAQLSDLIGEVRRLTANLTQLSDQINREPTKLLFGDRRKGYTPMANNPLFARRAFLVSAAALALAGCADIVGPGSSPSLYVMRPEFAPGPTGAAKVDWSLAVMRPYAPDALAGTRIAILQPGSVMDFYADAAYPDSLPDLVQQAVIRGFEATGRIDNVSRSSDSLYADYSLFVEVRDFTAQYSAPDGIPDAVVSLHVRMARARGRQQLGALTVTETMRAGANTVPAATQALAQALAAAINRITPWALTFPPPSPRPAP